MEELDHSQALIPTQARDPSGEKGFDPRMMTMLLLYSYCVGIASPRRIERACYEDLAFRVLTGHHQPDRSRISEFWGSPGYRRRGNGDWLQGRHGSGTLRIQHQPGSVCLAYGPARSQALRMAWG
ncbi:transposase [Vulcanococcus limneticus]|uniref:transposase n=1 Tax=Vulcanococcus limneticus TaxID=2170428 RepID=UPI00398BEC5D